ncbi:MAG: prepilin-type N-terminal cleavage/methylation domain-containing protein [Candidatus Aminicenantales bacterium]
MKNQISDSNARGFTLIEVIVVLTIIGILIGLALPQYQNAARRARESVLKENLFQLRKLIDQYFTDKGKYPASLQSLVQENYLRKIPIDPITGSSETWMEIRENPPAEEIEPGMELGIVDVLSGSDKKSLDGTLYNTW